ncbi:MAG: hypothetical protein KatS3mg003_1926 [Candidatus Nitrosocaldaceae archaeon]|nr:MAG: hypothetical protein KatS3mg003_1926 [Candidatus Nitrosocaldaceae archaeon]
MEDRSKTEEAIKLLKSTIPECNNNYIELFKIYVSLANYLRRDKNYDDAWEYILKAENILPHIDKVENAWEYGKFLNIRGLIEMERNKLKDAEEHCRESAEVRRKNGYIREALMSYNALGLILQKLNNLNEAEEILNKVIDQGIRIGYYRIYQQALRNLLLIYKEGLNSNRYNIDEYYKKIEQHYRVWNEYVSKKDYSYSDLTFAIDFVFGEVFKLVGNLEMAQYIFKQLYNHATKNYNEKWHNIARILDQLRDIYKNNGQTKEHLAVIGELIELYANVIRDKNKLSELKGIKLNNAKDFLNNIKKDLNDYAYYVDSILKEI